MNYERFSRRTEFIKLGEAHKSFELAKKPGMISFAGGYPASEFFPIEEIKKASNKVLDENGIEALQYSTAEGYIELRKIISKRMLKLGVKTSEDNILITNGSQQALDLSGRIFINEGDAIICERPTFLAAIQSFKVYMPKFKEVSIVEDGIDIEELENLLKNTENIKFLYTIPDFQNPTGRTMSLAKRKKIIELANKYDFIIIEDSPYGELSFIDEKLPAIKSFDTEGRVMFLGTFSKILVPGLRVGWVCADVNFLQKYTFIKQVTDIHTDMLAQMIIAEFINTFDIEEHITHINKMYKIRKDLMIECIKKEFPYNIKYTMPNGGLFIWIELPEGNDALEILKKALKENVIFFAGDLFYSNNMIKNTFRLNFSNMTEKNIVEGIKRLGRILRNNIQI